MTNLIEKIQEFNYHYKCLRNGKLDPYYSSQYMWVDDISTEDKITVRYRFSNDYKGSWEFHKQPDGKYIAMELGYTKTFYFSECGVSDYSKVTTNEIINALRMESKHMECKYLECNFHPWADKNFNMEISTDNPINQEVTA